MHKSESLMRLSHHAYCLIGSDSVRLELKSILEKGHGIQSEGNPDFFDRTYETFTIENAREVRASHETRPVSDYGKKIFILKMNGITVEAQNALLKLLEEPSEYSHFFIIIPSAHLLLPTVKSRLSFIKTTGVGKDAKNGENASNGQFRKDASEFIALKPAKRIERIKSLLDEIAKEKRPKQDAIEFLNAVEQVVYREMGIRKGSGLLESISLAGKYMNDRAPSIKMLLEYMALQM